MSSLSPVDQAAFLWSEPTYEWDEVVSLLGDARSTERAKYAITEDMYHTALDVLQMVSSALVRLCVCRLLGAGPYLLVCVFDVSAGVTREEATTLVSQENCSPDAGVSPVDHPWF